MKLITTIDARIDDERVEIYARKDYPVIAEIKKILDEKSDIIGFLHDGSFKVLDMQTVNSFSIIGGKLYAKTDTEQYDIKKRLYEIEDILPAQFQKISQSCIVNLSRVLKFELFFNGSLACRFVNDIEYVSRRYIKNLKERLGI